MPLEEGEVGFPLADILHSDGVMPVFLLKNVLKYREETKPILPAISVKLRSVNFTNSSARSILIPSIYSLMLDPVICFTLLNKEV